MSKDPEVLWADPENPTSTIELRNGILSIRHDGITRLKSLKDLFRTEVSADIAEASIFPVVGPNPKPFHYSELVTALEEIAGQKSTGVCLGMSGFYDRCFKRVYRTASEQLTLAQRLKAKLEEYDLLPKTEILVSVGEIRILIYHFVANPY